MDELFDEIVDPLWEQISRGYGCGCCARGAGISEYELRRQLHGLLLRAIQAGATKEDIERIFI